MSEREWYPEHFVDEACPPAKATPDDFIIEIEGGLQLGYKHSDFAISDDDVETYNEPLEVGELVNFLCCDRFDDVEVTFNRDGTYELHGVIPPEANWCRLEGDQDTLHDSFENLAKAVTGQANDGLLDLNIFHGTTALITSQRMTVEFARWSERIPHKLIVRDGKPVFEQVSAASVNN